MNANQITDQNIADNGFGSKVIISGTEYMIFDIYGTDEVTGTVTYTLRRTDGNGSVFLTADEINASVARCHCETPARRIGTDEGVTLTVCSYHCWATGPVAETETFDAETFERAAYRGYVSYEISMTDGYYAPKKFDHWVIGFRNFPEHGVQYNDMQDAVKAELPKYMAHLNK